MYLLDTNVMSELMRQNPNPLLEARFESEKAELFTSAICIEEIRYGAKIGPPGNKLWERLRTNVLPFMTVLALDENWPSRQVIFAPSGSSRERRQAMGMA